MAEVTLQIDAVPTADSDEIETLQENEHEIQSEELQAWSAALSNVTQQMGALSQAFEVSRTESTEMRTLISAQAELIRSLMDANAQANAQLLETVRNLLTPPPPPEIVVAATPTEIPPAVVPAEVAVPQVAETRRRFRGI